MRWFWIVAVVVALWIAGGKAVRAVVPDSVKPAVSGELFADIGSRENQLISQEALSNRDLPSAPASEPLSDLSTLELLNRGEELGVLPSGVVIPSGEVTANSWQPGDPDPGTTVYHVAREGGGLSGLPSELVNVDGWTSAEARRQAFIDALEGYQ